MKQEIDNRYGPIRVENDNGDEVFIIALIVFLFAMFGMAVLGSFYINTSDTTPAQSLIVGQAAEIDKLI